jgi:hypothetical protein
MTQKRRLRINFINSWCGHTQPGAGWDQMASGTFHAKKSKKPQKFLQKTLFDILYGRL